MTAISQVDEKDNRWLRSFTPLWGGQAMSLLGSRLVQFALVWHLTVQTGSTAVLATATLVALLPEVLLGPFAGALVDRWDRRKVMIFADSAVALTTLVLVLLFLTGTIQIWHIYAAMFLRGLGGAFHWPAMQASTSLMVPQKHLARLSGANQALQGLLSIAAPPLGALLLSWMPMHWVLSIDIGTAALAIMPLLFIAIPRPVHKDGVQTVTPESVLRDVGSGLKYVASWPGMLAILLMAMVINFLINPAFSFLPLLVTRQFQGGAVELGWLESGFGVGVITGGVLLSLWGGFKKKVFTSMTGLIGMGTGVFLVGLSGAEGYWLAFAGLAITGFMNPLVNGPLFALLQSKVDPEMQGRVFTLVVSGSGAITPLGMLVAAPVADWLGIQAWYIVGGIVCAFMGVCGFLIKAVNSIEQQEPGGNLNAAINVKTAPAVASD
jgi:DHA3 family macrolide efflux protein-like MFS transporter